MDTMSIAFSTIGLVTPLGMAIGQSTDALIKCRPENQNVQPPVQPGIQNHPHKD